MKTLALLAVLVAAAPAIAQDGWVQKGTADIVVLDKVRGQPASVSVKAGNSTVFGSLTIKVRSCYVRPPDQPADATAFLDVTETRNQSGVFHGWMLTNTPSVSVMEHPIYDLRLAGCR